MKHMRKLLAMLLVIALVASMVPAVFAADNDLLAGYDLTSQPEGIDDSALDAVWAEIDTMYDLSATKDGSVDDPEAVAQKAAAIVEGSDTYVEGTLQWNGNAAFTWETTTGMPCMYNNYQMEMARRFADLDLEAADKDVVDDYRSHDTITDYRIQYEFGLQKLQAHAFGAKWGDNGSIALFGPYYGDDENFTDVYLINAMELAKAKKSTLLVFTSTAATLDMIGQAMDQANIVMIDTHGTTDYYNSYYDTTAPYYDSEIEDCTSRANSSYICLKTSSTITSADAARHSGPFGTYYDAVSGSSFYGINGAAIANHMKANRNTNNFAWIGCCLGMATDKICNPLLNAGVGAIYGYSQSVTFLGDMAYLNAFTKAIAAGKNVAEAASSMKAQYGPWDTYYHYYYTDGTYYDYYPVASAIQSSGYRPYTPSLSMVQQDKAAFPIVVSYKDPYPGQGRVDNYQTVKCEWYLNSHPTFYDVPTGAFYYNPVTWAVGSNVTSGMSAYTFAPMDPCTRGHVVTFLWRAAGCPEPKSTSTPFTDVSAGKFYYKAVLWAVENGITAGMTPTTFEPNSYCTRGQVVTFLWRAAGKPAASSTSHPFTDVSSSAFYYKAMLWAVENGITAGMSKTTFAPNNICTRGQVVTFLSRAFAS